MLVQLEKDIILTMSYRLLWRIHTISSIYL